MSTTRTIRDLRRTTDLQDKRSFDHIGRDAGASSLITGETLAEIGGTNSKIVCGTADIQFVTHLAEFRLKFPERFFQFGISERNMIGAAAGLAASGFIPYVATFACFLGGLGYENIRTDLAYTKLPVRLLATHAGVAMGFFGTSHHATEDIAALRAVANLMILSPSDGPSLAALLKATVDHQGPIYFRLGRGRDVAVHPTPAFITGPGEPIIVNQGGGDVLIVSTGSMVAPSIMAAKALATKAGREVATVFDVHTIKPFYADTIAAAVETGTKVLVVEEHNVEGGLGTIVTEALLDRGLSPWLYKHGFYDEFSIVGPPQHLYRYYGLDAEGIATVAARLGDAGARPQARSLWTVADRQAALLSVHDRRQDRSPSATKGAA